jgi:Inner membrane component of T3SS, cytoplasmic domain
VHTGAGELEEKAVAMDTGAGTDTGASHVALAVRVEAYSWQSAIARKSLVALGDRPLVIGSDSRCDIAIYDAAVAPKHAAIIPTPDGGHAVKDLGSATGTWVQGALIAAPVRLAAEQTIRIGDAALMVVALAPAVVAHQGVQPVSTPGESVPPPPGPQASPHPYRPAAVPALPARPTHAVPAAPSNVQPLSQRETFPAERGRIATVPYCPLCALTYPQGAKVCTVCGSRLAEAMAN